LWVKNFLKVSPSLVGHDVSYGFARIDIKVSLAFEKKFGVEGGRAGGSRMTDGGADFKKNFFVKTIKKPRKRGMFVENLDPIGLVKEIFDVMIKLGFGTVDNFDTVGIIKGIEGIDKGGGFLRLGAKVILNIVLDVINEGLHGVNSLFTGIFDGFGN
jgi:hypothetical protein